MCTFRIALRGLLVALLAAAGLVAGSQPASAALPDPTYKVLHFNMSGALVNGGEYAVVEQIRDRILQRSTVVVSLNEVCERQYEHLLVLLQQAGYTMQGNFGKTANTLGCQVGADLRTAAGNAVLVRGTVTQRQKYLFYRNPVTDTKLLVDEAFPPTDPVLAPTGRGIACVTARLEDTVDTTKACSMHLSTSNEGGAAPDIAEIVRVFGPEARAGRFLLMGDTNLTPNDPAMATLYAAPAGTGDFVEADSYRSCTANAVDCIPQRGGAATYSDRKIDYVFASARHFTVPAWAYTEPGSGEPTEIYEPGTCDGHPCSDHRFVASMVTQYDSTKGFGRLQNDNSFKCLLVRGSTTNTQLRQYTCGTGTQYPDQFWKFEYQNDGTYLVRNQSSNQCMLVRGTANSAPVVQYTCGTQFRDQHWIIIRSFDGVQLRNAASAKCLAVRTTANEALAVQSTCNSTSYDQLWWSL